MRKDRALWKDRPKKAQGTISGENHDLSELVSS